MFAYLHFLTGTLAIHVKIMLCMVPATLACACGYSTLPELIVSLVLIKHATLLGNSMDQIYCQKIYLFIRHAPWDI